LRFIIYKYLSENLIICEKKKAALEVEYNFVEKTKNIKDLEDLK
jgi:hypothetical protein